MSLPYIALKSVAVFAALFFFADHLKAQEPPGASWERFDTEGRTEWSDCLPIPKDWTLPVLAPKRAEAIALIESVDHLAITHEALPYWTGVSYTELPEWSLDSIHEGLLEFEPELAEAAKSPPRLEDVHPFLIRAVAKNEFSGRFEAYECAEGVSIHHGSLGRNEVPTKRLPVVVLLRREPAMVAPTWSMDE